MRSLERAVLALFDDLEQQAEGLALAEREAEVGDLVRAEYAAVPWASRLHGSRGQRLRVRLLGGRVLEGELARVGADFFVLAGVDWLVRTSAVTAVAGLAERGVDERARAVPARLTLRAMLRRLAELRTECQVLLVDDGALTARPGRVGRDFVELHAPDGRVDVVPLDALAAVQGQP